MTHAVALVVALLACRGPGEVPLVDTTVHASSPIAYNPVLDRVYAGGQDVPYVFVFDGLTGAPLPPIELPEGAQPRQVAVSPDGQTVYASDWALGQAYLIDAADGTVNITADVGKMPYGIAVGPLGRADVYLASYGWNQGRVYSGSLEETRHWSFGWGDDVAEIDEGSVSKGWDPRTVFFDQERNALYFGHQMNGRISKVELHTVDFDGLFLAHSADDDPTVSQGVVYGIEHFSRSPDGRYLYVPHILWNPRVALGETRAVWPAVSIVDLESFEEVDRLQIGDGLDIDAGLATPVASAPSPDGDLLYVVFEGSSELVVIDLEQRQAIQALDLPGAGARGLALSRDGDQAWVYLATEPAMAVVDLSDASQGGAVVQRTIGVERPSDPVAEAGWREGKTLFYEASSTTSDGAHVACGTCHIDGMTRTIRWFVLDHDRDESVDVRFGHPTTLSGFSATDPDAAVGDLIRMFQEVGGMVGEDPEAPSPDHAAALASLESWLHGPENLPFFGSWASTVDGRPTDPAAWPSDEECASCHQEIYDEYQGSMHANAGTNDPFFQVIEADVGVDVPDSFTTWCLGCHSTQVLLSGGTTTHDGPSDDEARRGLSCLACHGAIDFRAAEGNNSIIYDPVGVIAAGYPEEGDDPSAHIEAMTINRSARNYEGKLALGASGFCGSCHQSYTPGIGVTEFLTYQEYLDSAFHGAEHENEQRCADCHMPTDKGWADHSFYGPSVWFPTTYGTQDQVDRAVEFVQTAAELTVSGPSTVGAGNPIVVDVTVDNIGAGHNLPTGVSNLRQMWLEVHASVNGQPYWSSGEIGSDGTLPENAHVFGKVLGDADGNHLDMHQVWRIATIEDRTIRPSGKVVSTFMVPPGPAAGETVDVTVTLRMRALPRALVERALGDEAPPLPVIDMATGSKAIGVL